MGKIRDVFAKCVTLPDGRQIDYLAVPADKKREEAQPKAAKDSDAENPKPVKPPEPDGLLPVDD
jgi:hypothetical protein